MPGVLGMLPALRRLLILSIVDKGPLFPLWYNLQGQQSGKCPSPLFLHLDWRHYI